MTEVLRRRMSEVVSAFTAMAPNQETLDRFINETHGLLSRFTSGTAQPKSKPRVYLAMPRYGQVDPEMSRAALVTGSDDKIQMTAADRCSSLLANGFNQAWVECMNLGTFDYFAMLHSDIAPSDNWLDILIEELELHDADVIHAVSPIKDSRGLTSTAIGRMHDPWAKVRRLTVTETQMLPQTFCLADICCKFDVQETGLCLLPNTGCMVVKIKPWCRKFSGFTINDRIVEVNGQLVAQVEPEDWGFGRWCALHGLEVIGTRKVKIEHYGRAKYPNDCAWGSWSRDEYYFSKEDAH